MKRIVVVAAVLLTLASTAAAQGWGGGSCPGPGRGPGACAGGAGPCSGQGPHAYGGRGGWFDPATVTSTSGQVETIQTAGGRGQAVFVQMKTTDRGLVDVRLGPSWFLQQQKLTVAKGDHLEITGSMVEVADGEIMVAQHVKKGDLAVTLRDASGLPAWAGWRKR